MRADPRHDQIRRQVEKHIAHVEQCQTGRYLFGGEVELRCEIVALLDVHGLREADVGSDGRAHEIQNPERGQDSAVEFAGVWSAAVLQIRYKCTSRLDLT